MYSMPAFAEQILALENRLRILEENNSQRLRQQLSYPIDVPSTGALKRALDKEQIRFLTPLETAAANEGTSTLLNNTACIQFADAATREAYFALALQQNATISSLRFIWSTPATSGNLRWQIDFGAGGDSDATNARTTGGTAVSTAADGTANDLNFTEITGSAGINFASLLSVKDQILGIKFTRLGADAADTLSNTVNLYGLLITHRLFT